MHSVATCLSPGGAILLEIPSKHAVMINCAVIRIRKRSAGLAFARECRVFGAGSGLLHFHHVDGSGANAVEEETRRGEEAKREIRRHFEG